ncbi:MAG: sulfurtransferase [Anaerolineae bacterium]|nr:sulfurtransferase [Anaerolineae bacterium]
MSKNGYAHPEVLVETEWVAQHLHDPRLRLVEMDVDTTAYRLGHIPTAVGWNWQVDTRDALRRNIPDPATFAALMSRSGIANETTVVLYGDKNNWFAAYAFWLMKYYGHVDLRLMNGGRKKWVAEKRLLTKAIPDIQPTTYQVKVTDADVRALRDRVLARLRHPDTALIDVRSAKEFTGDLAAPEHLLQEGAQRGGHIPGAVNIAWGQTVQADGTFKSAEALQRLYHSRDVTPDKEVITYCRIGERSSHTWFVLRYLLGYPHVRNYDGSWVEWGNLIDVPIER